MTTPVVGVRFKRAGKVYYFNVTDRGAQPKVGDKVVADTQRGLELGRVVLAPEQVLDSKGLGRLKAITRMATPQDLEGEADNRGKEREALQQARQEGARLGLPMHPIQAEYAFDATRATVYYLSEEAQLDTRELVRVLSDSLQVRVSLRQLGPRDRAKLLGGIDRCGRELCCSSWLTEFQPIQIRMAKNQQLPLNPSEISGVCGKLLCCLSFEDDQYAAMSKGLPKLGANLVSAVGRGRVTDVNVLTRQITISWETGSRIVVDAEAFAEQQERRQRAMAEGVPAHEALVEFEEQRAARKPQAPVVEALPPRLDGATRPEPASGRSGNADGQRREGGRREDLRPEGRGGGGRRQEQRGPRTEPRPPRPGPAPAEPRPPRPGQADQGAPEASPAARPEGGRSRPSRRRRDRRRGGQGPAQGTSGGPGAGGP